jgi:nuclear transport factor 2 (NTF2) superfamily protein
MLTQDFTEEFAREWIAAWNSRDLDRILAHYTGDFEMSSPVIVRVAGKPSGRLRGKKAVGAYWTKALAANRGLHFELITTLRGIGSIVIYYQGARGLAAELFEFDESGLVRRSAAHYADP